MVDPANLIRKLYFSIFQWNSFDNKEEKHNFCKCEKRSFIVQNIC